MADFLLLVVWCTVRGDGRGCFSGFLGATGADLFLSKADLFLSKADLFLSKADLFLSKADLVKSCWAKGGG